jgi:hypothetical protein
MFDDLVRLEGRLLKEGRTQEASAIRSLLMLIQAMDTESQLKDKTAHEWMGYEKFNKYCQKRWWKALREWCKKQKCTSEELTKVI